MEGMNGDMLSFNGLYYIIFQIVCALWLAKLAGRILQYGPLYGPLNLKFR